MEGERKDRTDPRLRRTLVWFAIGAAVGVLVPLSVSLVSHPKITVENLSVLYLGSCSFDVSFDLWKRDNDELAVVYQIFVNDVGDSALRIQGTWRRMGFGRSGTPCPRHLGAHRRPAFRFESFRLTRTQTSEYGCLGRDSADPQSRLSDAMPDLDPCPFVKPDRSCLVQTNPNMKS